MNWEKRNWLKIFHGLHRREITNRIRTQLYNIRISKSERTRTIETVTIHKTPFVIKHKLIKIAIIPLSQQQCSEPSQLDDPGADEKFRSKKQQRSRN